MLNLTRDLITLAEIDLPASLAKKRVLANFAALYLRSLPEKLTGGAPANQNMRGDVRIESAVWKSFNHVISMYVKYLSPKFLLETYLIRSVASGWHSRDYIAFLREHFTPAHKSKIHPDALETVDEISGILAREFSGLNADAVKTWLTTYQYGFSEFFPDRDAVYKDLQHTRIIELGAGVGANAAVHAAISQKGVSIFDIPPMLEIQKIVTSTVARSLPLSPIAFYDDPQRLMEDARKEPYIVVSYWAFTEFPESLRRTLDPLLANARFCLFACNREFEGVNNLQYFEEAQSRLPDRTIESQPIAWNSYKQHSYVCVR